MARFMILFKSTQSASELMANSTPEQMQTGMQQWTDWKDNLDGSIGFEWGMPLQVISEVSTTQITEGNGTVSGYAIMQGDKDAVCSILQTHPHLRRPGATIDVLEMLSMPDS